MSKLKRLLCLALTVLTLMSCAAMPAWAEGEEIPLTWEEYIDAMILSPEGALITASAETPDAAEVSGLSDAERIEAAAVF